MNILAADCIEVKGYQRSTICDLRRQAFYEGPHINNLNELDAEYIDFLSENELIVQVPNEVAHAFKALVLDYDNYSLITNAIIQFGQHLTKTLEILEWSLCYNFAVIISKPIELAHLSKFLNETYHRNFNSIELHFLMPEHLDGYLLQLNNLLQEYTYINPYLYTANQQILNDVSNLKINRFLLRPQSSFMKNYVRLGNFYCNIELFVESQKHNTYYNRKIFIDSNGNLSNIYEGEKFANVIDLKNREELLGIINRNDFQFLWKVSKNVIDVCKDCEYRHLCIDSRIPIQRADGTWYHTTECSYNPYICKWKNEDGFVDLKSSGVTVANHEFNINKDKLNHILELVYDE